MTRTSDPDVLLLQAAADPIRLRMLRQLSLGEVCACDFTDGTLVTQPTISHHLRVLREAGWVNTQRRGTWIYYSLRPEALQRFARVTGSIDAAANSGRRLPVLEPA